MAAGVMDRLWSVKELIESSAIFATTREGFDMLKRSWKSWGHLFTALVGFFFVSRNEVQLEIIGAAFLVCGLVGFQIEECFEKLGARLGTANSK